MTLSLFVLLLKYILILHPFQTPQDPINTTWNYIVHLPHASSVPYSVYFYDSKSGHFLSTYVNPFSIFPAMNLLSFIF